ncbi:response regulator [Methylobacterium sp. DB0501]|uniref:Response regulator n=4 Tax=Methylobacteriaceae TaxID=119045 RepID=A0A2R4WRS6_9HYPH|nr:response regulator [Methylobacterium currus]AWB24233.1 response regulator [Methylobacterium currus]NGM35099.1 response regulator [Methylobacterium sp. DB0501]
MEPSSPITTYRCICESVSHPEPCALVVDDDGLIRMDAMDILQDAGFRTFEASDGDKAMTLLAREHAVIVLLFTDVQMPGTRNGFAVARETASRWPHIAIVVASGHVRPEPGEMPEVARFIGKPFTSDMVHDHLRDILPDGRKPAPLRNREQAGSAP